MKIGIVTTWFERGAAYVSKQFEEILKREHEVFIYARGGEEFAKGNPKWDTPNVYWTKFRSFAHYINKKEFQGWLIKNNIDMVLFNEQRTFEPMLWCKELNIATIAYIDYYSETSIPLFNVYDAIICNTRRHYSAFEEHPHRFYLPWGTDTDLYKPQSKNSGLVQDGYVTFFNSAGMSPQRKGTDTFIKALDLCKDIQNIKAFIHSQVDLRKCFPLLVESIDELVESGKLEIVEKTISAPGLYYKGDVYVYPSILDGIGLTVPEAISSGLACIASNNPPMNEFVKDSFGALIPINRLYAREDGYYWPQCRCDVNALAEIIKDFASNPQNVITKKKLAREYAIENLSFEKNASNIFEILKSIQITAVDSNMTNRVRAFDQKVKKDKLLDLKMGIKYAFPFLFKQ